MAASKAAQKAIQEALSAFSGTAAEKQGLESFISSLKHSDLPTGWQDNPAIVDAAAKMYQQGGTESPFFKAWGGREIPYEEAMQDQTGKVALRGYHGTGEEYDSFEPAWVQYDKGRKSLGLGGLSEGKVAEYKNDPLQNLYFQGLDDGLAKSYASSHETPIVKELFMTGNSPKFMKSRDLSLEQMVDGGKDSALFYDTNAAGRGQYPAMAVRSPTQIKSTSNRGTFDPSDPNILRGIGIGAAGLGALTAPNLATASTMQKVNKLGQFDQFAKDMPATNDIPTAMRMAQQYSQRSGIDPDAAYKVLQALGRITPEKGLEEPVWSPIDLAAAPVGAVGALGKGAAMALDAPVTYAMDAGIEGLMKLLRGKNESSLY